MTFADLTAGDSVFLDANTFIYHFGPDPVLGPPCRTLFEQIDKQDLIGWTSTHVLAEVAHKLMTIEASALFGWSMTGMANRLRRHPAEVQQLAAYQYALDEVAKSPLNILAPSMDALRNAAAICRQTGLLINDSLVVSLMREQGLNRLASHDADFDRVAGLVRYAPV
jgi:predicted nucleic acid-binding protein